LAGEKKLPVSFFGLLELKRSMVEPVSIFPLTLVPGAKPSFGDHGVSQLEKRKN
jgi:hypothetical protein